MHRLIEYEKINLKNLKYLLNHKASLNVYNRNSETPMHIYFFSKNISLEILNFMIEKKGEINKLGESLFTCLDFYLRKNSEIDYSIVNFMFEKKGHFNKYSNDFVCRFDLNVYTLKLFLENQLNLKNLNESLPHLILKNHNHFSFIKCLTDFKIDINSKDSNGNSLFQFHFVNYQLTTISSLSNFLIENKAEMNHKNNQNQTVLHLFSKRSTPYFHFFQFLFQNKADPNIKDYNNLSPLHYVSKNEKLSYRMLHLFLENKAQFFENEKLDFFLKNDPTHFLQFFNAIKTRNYFKIPLYEEEIVWNTFNHHLFHPFFKQRIFSLLLVFQYYSKLNPMFKLFNHFLPLITNYLEKKSFYPIF